MLLLPVPLGYLALSVGCELAQGTKSHRPSQGVAGVPDLGVKGGVREERQGESREAWQERSSELNGD